MLSQLSFLFLVGLQVPGGKGFLGAEQALEVLEKRGLPGTPPGHAFLTANCRLQTAPEQRVWRSEQVRVVCWGPRWTGSVLYKKT